jgi:uncharacterized protein (TIGR03435 family)
MMISGWRVMRPKFILLFCVCFAGASGQTAGELQFEAATIKPSPPSDARSPASGCRGGPGTSDPGLFTCSNMPLAYLLDLAYQLDANQLSAPDWLADTQLLFDVNAKVLQGTTKEQLSIMFQNLLTDRFKIALHRETRDMQQYDLVVAKNGPKFKASAPAGSPADKSPLQKDGCPPLPSGLTVNNGLYLLHMPDWSMAVFSGQMAYLLHAHITDATGLTGNYDIAMCWAPENTAGAAAGPNGVPVAMESGPTLQQAVQDQLGLRLESKKAPVEVIVVEHAEKLPTDN